MIDISIVIIFIGVLLCLLVIIIFMLYTDRIKLSSEKELDISKVMPIQFIEKNTIVNGNGDITVGYNLSLPEVFTLSEDDVASISEQLSGVFKLLPPGTTIHQQNFFYTLEHHDKDHVENYLFSANQHYFDGREILQSYSNLYITFANKPVIKKENTNTSLLRKPNYLFKEPFKNIVSREKEIDNVLLNFETSLAAIDLFVVKKMRSADLNNAVFDYCNQSYDLPTKDATNEVLSSISLSDQDNFLIGNKHIAVLSLIEEGASLELLKTPKSSKISESNIDVPTSIRSKASINYPLTFGLPFNHVVNVTIEITDSDNVLNQISREKNGMNFIANFYPPAKAKQSEQEEFCNEITKHDYQTCITSFNVVLSDENKNSLDRKIAHAKLGFNRMSDSKCFIENVETANLFFCNVPGNANTNYRGFISTVIQSICYLQKENFYVSSPTGHIFCDRFGRPVKLEMWHTPLIVNRNMITIGPSGSGKSFLLNNLMLQEIIQQKDIILLDIGGSFQSMISLNRGKYFDSASTSKFQFNPFLCEMDNYGNYIYLNTEEEEFQDEHIKTISNIISYIWKGKKDITPIEKSILDRSIKEFYEYVNTKRVFPDLINYAEYLNEFEKGLTNYERSNFEIEGLKILLQPYTVGDYKFLLNGKEKIDIVNDKLIGFDMESVSQASYFPIVVILVLQLVTDKIKQRQGIEKELYIDEALDFLQDAKFGDFIAYLFRTFRKKEGKISLSAQNVEFLMKCPDLIRESILINCEIKIVLDHSQHLENLKKVKDIFSLTNKEYDDILSLQRTDHWREFFIKMNNKSFVFRNEVSPISGVAFDSRQKTVVRIKELIKETGSTYSAINKYIEEKQLI